jgi:hypothetical protein
MTVCAQLSLRRLGHCMRRDVLLLEQMIEAADQAVALVEGVGIQDLAADRIRRDALLWKFHHPGRGFSPVVG